jgi:hypothetical protein
VAEGEEDEGEEKEEDEEGEDEEGGAAAAAPKRNSKAAELGGMEYTSWGWGRWWRAWLTGARSVIAEQEAGDEDDDEDDGVPAAPDKRIVRLEATLAGLIASPAAAAHKAAIDAVTKKLADARREAAAFVAAFATARPRRCAEAAAERDARIAAGLPARAPAYTLADVVPRELTSTSTCSAVPSRPRTDVANRACMYISTD